MCVHGVLQWTGITLRMYSHSQCSQDGLWIYCDPVQGKDEKGNNGVKNKEKIYFKNVFKS